VVVKIALAIVAVLLLSAGVGLWAIQQPAVVLAPVPVSAAAAASAQTKISELQGAARKPGQAATVTLSNTEMTSYIASRAPSNVSGLEVHASSGDLVATGTMKVSGLSIPVTVHVAVSSSSGGQPQFKVTSIDTGALPLPGGVVDQISGKIESMLAQATSGPSKVTSIQLNDGQLTVSVGGS
jgi:uncharacterized protein YpmS